MRRGRFERPNVPIGPILENLGVSLPGNRGGWVRLRCPLHDDDAPSAAVNFEANRFVCRAGCTDPRGEDAIGLIQLVEGLGFPAAKREAERIAGPGHGGVSRKPPARRTILDEPWG